jgi:tRNA splicing ligase
MKSKRSLSLSTGETQISVPEDVGDDEYRTMLNRSIREFNKTYGPKTKKSKKKQQKKSGEAERHGPFQIAVG